MACRPVEHPRRNFQPTVCLRSVQSAAKNDMVSLVDSPMNANSAAKPSMMPIKNLAKNDPVGVLKPRCTTTSERIDHWTKMPRLSPDSADREHQIVPRPRRIPSPLRPSLSFRYTHAVESRGDDAPGSGATLSRGSFAIPEADSAPDRLWRCAAAATGLSPSVRLSAARISGAVLGRGGQVVSCHGQLRAACRGL